MSECNFIPYQKVLVRDEDEHKWQIEFFEKYVEGAVFKYVCLAHSFKQCIAFEGNEHLLDTDKPFIDPYDFTDGDIVRLEIQKRPDIRIFHEVTAYGAIYVYAEPSEIEKGYVLKDNKYFMYCQLKDLSEKIFPADKVIEEQYLSKFEEIGKKWNAEKKEFEEFRWVPEEGEIFYTAYFDPVEKVFYADQSTWPSVISNRVRELLDRGWVFKKEEQCEPLCERLTQAIADVK